MTLKECYAAMQADFDDVFGRLRSERLVQKFVLKFLDDGSYDLLCSSMASGDVEQAFRASHTIKGMCQNLGFTRLGESSHDLTEALRAHDMDKAPALFEQVKADYAQTTNAIQTFKAGLGA